MMTGMDSAGLSMFSAALSAIKRRALLRPRTLSELASLPSRVSVMMGLRSSMVPTVAATALMRPPRRRYFRSST